MRAELNALEKCAQLGLDPAEVLQGHYFMSEDPEAGAGGGFRQLRVGRWVFNYGQGLRVIPLRDRRGQIFGVFAGYGVDAHGAYVDDLSFAGFDSRSERFWPRFEEYVAGIAGRYVVVAATGGATRAFFDPLAHLASFYNPRARLLASSVFLAIDREPLDNPHFDARHIHYRAEPDSGKPPHYALGHTMDAEVFAALPNHRLDLGGFRMERTWPQERDIAQVPRAQAEGVIDEMVWRLRQVAGTLAENEPCALAMAGDCGSRGLLACLTGRADDLEAVHAHDDGTSAGTLGAHTAELGAAMAGVPFTRLTPAEAAARLGGPMDRRHTRLHKRLWWLRTSRSAVPPAGYMARLHLLEPRDSLALNAAGMGLLSAEGWRDASGAAMPDGLTHEIGRLFAMDAPPADLVGTWTEAYQGWKSTLPEAARALAPDFIEIELRQHVAAAAWHGLPEHFRVSPFADRRLIQLALSLPVELRLSGWASESFLVRADARLASLPYGAAVAELIDNGGFFPALVQDQAALQAAG